MLPRGSSACFFKFYSSSRNTRDFSHGIGARDSRAGPEIPVCKTSFF